MGFSDLCSVITMGIGGKDPMHGRAPYAGHDAEEAAAPLLARSTGCLVNGSTAQGEPTGPRAAFGKIIKLTGQTCSLDNERCMSTSNQHRSRRK